MFAVLYFEEIEERRMHGKRLINTLIYMISVLNENLAVARINGSDSIINIVDYTRELDSFISKLENMYYLVGGREILKRPDNMITNTDYINWLVEIHCKIVIQRAAFPYRDWMKRYSDIPEWEITRQHTSAKLQS